MQSGSNGVPRSLLVYQKSERRKAKTTRQYLSVLVFLARHQNYNFEKDPESSASPSAAAMAHLQSTQRQHSLLGLSLLSLSALTTHALLYQHHKSLPGTQIPAMATLPAILSVCGGVAGFFIWILSLSGDPAMEGARNKALLYGLGAANLGMLGLLMLRPGSSGSTYFGCVVWPALAGLAVGSLV